MDSQRGRMDCGRDGPSAMGDPGPATHPGGGERHPLRLGAAHLLDVRDCLRRTDDRRGLHHVPRDFEGFAPRHPRRRGGMTPHGHTFTRFIND